jgi:hypothetical protein
VPFEIAWRQPNGLIKRYFNHVTGREVMDANVLAEADARFDNLHYVINDFRGCTSLTASPDEIDETAAIDNAASKSNPNIRIAIVATHPDVLAATNSYTKLQLNAFVIRIFSSMDDAYAWLGLSGS